MFLCGSSHRSVPYPGGGCGRASGCQLTPKRPREPVFLLETHLFPFFIIRSALAGNAAFQSCQAVAVMHSLYCRLVVIQLLSFRDRIYKVSVDMCPTRAPFDTGYLVIPLITIGSRYP